MVSNIITRLIFRHLPSVVVVVIVPLFPHNAFLLHILEVFHYASLHGF